LILEFKCEKCEMKAKYVSKLDRHMNRKHKKIKIKRKILNKPEGWWLKTLLQKRAELADVLPEEW